MPIRDFVCKDCGEKQERVYVVTDERIISPTCRTCGGTLLMKERSQEGEGHTTHVRIR